MAPPSQTTSQSPLLELAPLPGKHVGKGLRLVRQGGLVAIFSGALPIHLYEADDRAAEAVAIATLTHAKAATRIEIAEAFGVHRNTVGRLADRLVQQGIAGLVPAKPGPKGPHKVTPEMLKAVAEAPDLQPVAFARWVAERTGVKLSERHLVRLRRRLPQAQLELPPSPEQLPPAVTGSVEGVKLAEQVEPGFEPPAVLPDRVRGRYLGAALYFPALRALGLVEAALACFRLPNSELFGVRATTLTLFFLTIFSKSTVEAAKHLRRWEFGLLVGSGRAPVVRTLRRKLGELVKQGQAGCFGTLLARHWVEQGLVATAYLYVDGHVKEYTGKRKLVEVWNSQRRMPLPGLLTYFVNDLQGRPLLFLTEEANASLAQAMPKVVKAIRDVLGDRPFTIIFDRGGYDSELFEWLRQEKIDFITYQRGEPKLPLADFGRRECRFEGRRVRMQIAEDRVKVKRSGPWRRIVMRTKDGHQTPILTSLDGLAAAKIACLMFARWRQENFFKYSSEHQGLDQLLGYAWAEADGERLVPNPERKRLERELKAKRQQLSELRSKLGQAVLDEPRDAARSAHGLKVAQKGAVGKLRALEQEIKGLAELRSALPAHIPLAQAGMRDVMRLEQKQIIDRIKITAYNAEEWLLELLLRHYRNQHDARALLRSFAELAGEIRTTEQGIVVTLDAPDIPLQRRVLRSLCYDLNRLGAVYPGTERPVIYQVALHHSEAAA